MARSGFWLDTFFSQALVNNSQITVSLMNALATEDSRRGLTCVRTIIGLDLARTVHDSGEGSHRVSMGIGVSSREALGVTGGIPDSHVAGDFPVMGWLYRAQYRIYGFAADQPAIFNQRIDKDIRAKRMLNNGVMYITMVSVLQEGVDSTIQMTGLIRQYWLAS